MGNNQIDHLSATTIYCKIYTTEEAICLTQEFKTSFMSQWVSSTLTSWGALRDKVNEESSSTPWLTYILFTKVNCNDTAGWAVHQSSVGLKECLETSHEKLIRVTVSLVSTSQQIHSISHVPYMISDGTGHWRLSLDEVWVPCLLGAKPDAIFQLKIWKGKRVVFHRIAHQWVQHGYFEWSLLMLWYLIASFNWGSNPATQTSLVSPQKKSQCCSEMIPSIFWRNLETSP